MSKATLNIFGELVREDVPLLGRWMLENRMNVRYMLPQLMTWAKEQNDQDFFNYLLKKSTIADVRDFIIYEREGKLSSTYRKIVNKWMYQLPEGLLTFWYHKYSANTFRQIFEVTHPKPDDWKLDWFQKAIFGEAVPEDSLVSRLRDLRKGRIFHATTDYLEELLNQRVSWHYLRKTFPVEEHLEIYLKHVPLRFLVERVQLYNENPELVKIALERLKGTPRINIAVILDAIEYLTPVESEEDKQLRQRFMDLADRILYRGIVDIEHIGKTAIIIDKSGSMQIAIKLGIALGGLVSVRLPKENVRVFLFDNNAYDLTEYREIESVVDMLEVRHKVEGVGGTEILPVLALMRKQMPKEGYDTVFLLTDGKFHDRSTWGMIDSHTREDVVEAFQWLKIKRLVYVKLKTSEGTTPFSFDGYKGNVLTLEPEDTRNAETLLAIASYWLNRKLLGSLQGIKPDVLSWTEASWNERKTITYAKAIKCGNCSAPIPPDMNFCLSCGCALEVKETDPNTGD